MSVLIDPTSGGVSNAGQQSTLTESPEGPDAIWSGLRLPCPVWKTKDLGTTTGGTVYTVSEEYVTGYIVPYLCGVAQGPTRFTETDKTLGTFTFDVAPDSGWPIHVDYAVYCDEDLQLHIPTLQGKGLPARTTIGKGIGQGSGSGSRVVVAGTSAGAPRFAWTENIFAASPTWTANNTGLPATATEVELLRLDPFNPSTTAFLVVDNVLYRNTTYRTGGSWSAIRTPGGRIWELELTIAQPSFVVMMDEGAGNTPLQMSHSHDGGTTWTVLDTGTTLIGGVQSVGGLLVGQHDATILYTEEDDGGGTNVFFDTQDGGHSGTWRGDGNFGIDVGFLSMPYPNNPSDLVVFYSYVGNLYKSTTGTDGINPGTLVNAGGGAPARVRWSSADANLAWGFSAKSTDAGATWTAITQPATFNDAALLRDIMWFAAAASAVYTSPSWTTGSFTARTGNLITGVFTGASPNVTGIVPDWTAS